MKKIYSITEAFSMQPCSFYVGMNVYPSNEIVAEIVLENVNVSAGGPELCYVGKNESGVTLFYSIAKSVNVVYQ